MDVLLIIGILVLFVFYGGYFAKALSLRKQGINANRLARGAKPSSTAGIERALKCATFMMAVIQLFSLLASKKWMLLIQNDVVRIIGLIIAFIGTGIFLTAMITMKSSWRAGIDATQQTRLIRNGIYHISRNPAFLGFDVFYIGFTLAFFNLAHALSLIFCVVALHLQILEEEKFLPIVFGQEYLEYKKATARYLSFKTSIHEV